MSKEFKNIDSLSNEINNHSEELKKTEDSFENKVLKIHQELEKYDVKINSMMKNLSIFKENSDKTKEYLLLELESNLDKLNQIQKKYENKSFELISFLKEDNSNQISILSEKIGMLKQQITEKNNKINNLTHNINNLNQLIEKKNEELVYLNQKFIDLSNDKDGEIEVLNKCVAA